jgi:hypothetical protein
MCRGRETHQAGTLFADRLGERSPCLRFPVADTPSEEIARHGIEADYAQRRRIVVRHARLLADRLPRSRAAKVEREQQASTVAGAG